MGKTKFGFSFGRVLHLNLSWMKTAGKIWSYPSYKTGSCATGERISQSPIADISQYPALYDAIYRAANHCSYNLEGIFGII